MSIKKSIFKIFNGTSWDEYHHKTSADQVVYTKADGTASNVQKQLDEQNSTLNTNIRIKSTGIEGHWQYRIWSNNQVELWWSSPITYNGSVTGAGIQGLSLTSVDLQLPFAVINASINASIQWGFSEWVQAQIENKNIVRIRKFGTLNSITHAKMQMTYMYIIGTLD